MTFLDKYTKDCWDCNYSFIGRDSKNDALIRCRKGHKTSETKLFCKDYE